jgi:hypothetical protein
LLVVAAEVVQRLRRRGRRRAALRQRLSGKFEGNSCLFERTVGVRLAYSLHLKSSYCY